MSLMEGFEILVVSMGLVFLLLTLLWAGIAITADILNGGKHQ